MVGIHRCELIFVCLGNSKNSIGLNWLKQAYQNVRKYNKNVFPISSLKPVALTQSFFSSIIYSSKIVDQAGN